MPRKQIIEVAAPPPVTDQVTSDLYYAGYLQARGVRLIKTEREGPRVSFTFDGSNAEELRRGWHDMSGMVSGLAYSNALRNLKDMLFRG